jgi:hypothetical protein
MQRIQRMTAISLLTEEKPIANAVNDFSSFAVMKDVLRLYRRTKIQMVNKANFNRWTSDNPDLRNSVYVGVTLENNI